MHVKREEAVHEPKGSIMIDIPLLEWYGLDIDAHACDSDPIVLEELRLSNSAIDYTRNWNSAFKLRNA